MSSEQLNMANCKPTSVDISNKNKDRRTFQIGTPVFDVEMVSRLFDKLRAIGMKAKFRQYLICGVFSHEEIESEELQKNIADIFSENLVEHDTPITESRFGYRFLPCGRIVVLLNDFGRHGEARLLDPTGTLRSEIGIVGEDSKNDTSEKHDYLKIMKQEYEKKFRGSDKEPVIVLLSDLPCTIEGSRLMTEYAERYKQRMIVSYDNCYQETNSALARANPQHENIYLMEPKLRIETGNKDVRVILKAAGRGRRGDVLLRVDSQEEPDDVVRTDCYDIPSKKQKRQGKKDKHMYTSLDETVRDDKRKKRGGLKGQISTSDRFSIGTD